MVLGSCLKHRVLSPDLILHVYRFCIMCTILKVIRAGVGFGSGTETNYIAAGCDQRLEEMSVVGLEVTFCCVGS